MISKLNARAPSNKRRMTSARERVAQNFNADKFSRPTSADSKRKGIVFRIINFRQKPTANKENSYILPKPANKKTYAKKPLQSPPKDSLPKPDLNVLHVSNNFYKSLDHLEAALEQVETYRQQVKIPDGFF